MKFETKAVHSGEEPNLKDGGAGDVAIPIHLASTFARRDVERPTGGYEYSRTSNPTRLALEKRLAALEGAEYGLAFSSGMAAETTIALTLLKSGDHVIAFDDLYGGTRRLFDKVFHANFDIRLSYVDASNTEAVTDAIKPETKLIWLETPTNPLMKLCDIAALTGIAKDHGILTVVDNTFMSPYFQNPLILGADIVVHSTTKFLNGHSDSVGGAVLLNDRELFERIQFNQNAAGAILSPFDSYLVLRGTKTLHLRMREHQKNGMAIAKYLESHPKVTKVHYPGLENHPQHELASKQASGYGGMLSFEIDGGPDAACEFLSRLEIFYLAESLGGVESLIEHPALMTHASIDRKEREAIGISDSLIRISCGVENVDDLIADLDNAFRKTC